MHVLARVYANECNLSRSTSVGVEQVRPLGWARGRGVVGLREREGPPSRPHLDKISASHHAHQARFVDVGHCRELTSRKDGLEVCLAARSAHRLGLNNQVARGTER
jgi:hypothetical protein